MTDTQKMLADVVKAASAKQPKHESATRETVLSIAQWHAETFPDADKDAQARKFFEEKDEWDASGKTDILELADMFIVACGICRFDVMTALAALRVVDSCRVNAGVEVGEFLDAIDDKMKINRARTWEQRGGLYKHK